MLIYLGRFLRRIKDALYPIVRAILRYGLAPFPHVRRLFYRFVVGPHYSHVRRDYCVRTKFGSRICGNTADIIQRYIYLFGEWEPVLTAWLRARLAAGDVFVDVGANIGYFTLYASNLVGESGKVIAVEASPRIFHQLAENIGRNNAGNVHPYNRAAAENSGRIRVFHGSEGNIGSTSLFRRQDAPFEFEVDAGPLDEIVPRNLVERIRIIKIDVEGAEWSVLAGMTGLMEAARHDMEIIMEVNPEMLREQGHTVEELLSVLVRHRYHPYRIKNEYQVWSYLRVGPIDARATRIRDRIVSQTDVVFSRIDAELI